MGNHPCQKLPRENYNGEDTLYSNRRHSESSKALEKEDTHGTMTPPDQNPLQTGTFLDAFATDGSRVSAQNAKLDRDRVI